MITRLTTLCCLLLLSAVLHAQTTVSGRVLTEQREPVAYATITITLGETFISGAMSQEDGRFEIANIANGDYMLHVSFVGYETVDRSLVIGGLNKTLDMGNIVLKEATVGIDEVTVVAERRAVAASLDRKSYSTEDILASAGGSVMDMMKALPGITVDQDSKIQLRGSDKVAILIDGKQSSLTGFGDQKGLENIPASQIESIEIINNPSARYDAAGMAGIVNIKFKQQKESGFNGDAGFTFGIGQLSKRKDDLPTGMPSYSENPKYTPSLNLNYKQDKINLYLQSYWIHQRRLPNNEFSTRYYPDGSMVESQVAENRSQNHYNVKLGMDWNLTSNQTLTLFGLYDYEWHIDTTRVWYFKDRNYDAPLRKWSFHESEGTGFTNVTLQHKFRFAQPGHELNSQYLYTKGWEDETYDLFQGETPGYPAIRGDQTHVKAPEHVNLLSTDYTRPLPFGRLEAGAQGRWRYMPITYTMQRAQGNSALIFDFGDWSKWRENLYAAYLNLVAEFARFDIEAGIRAEYTTVSYKFAPNQYFHDDSYDYFDLFPNVRLTFKLHDNHKLSLFYNRRIDRPGEDILRIFPKFDDPELLKVGNPGLRPQYTDAVEAAYRFLWQGGSFYVAGYYKNISDYYTRIYIQDPTHDQITIKGYDNIPRATNMGVEIAVDQQITSFWKLSASGNLYRNEIYATTGQLNFPVPVTYQIENQIDKPWFVKANNLFTLPAGVRFELSGSYFSERAIPQGKELARWGVDFGLRKSFLSDKLEVNLSATDLFNRMGIRQEINQGDGYSTEYQNYYETQVISLGAKYRF